MSSYWQLNGVDLSADDEPSDYDEKPVTNVRYEQDTDGNFRRILNKKLTDDGQLELIWEYASSSLLAVLMAYGKNPSAPFTITFPDDWGGKIYTLTCDNFYPKAQRGLQRWRIQMLCKITAVS